MEGDIRSTMVLISLPYKNALITTGKFKAKRKINLKLL
jgi:hypothetical protein